MKHGPHWIACWPPDAAALAVLGGADGLNAWAWRALAITPRVTWLDVPRVTSLDLPHVVGPNMRCTQNSAASKALVLELSAVLQLWGGIDAALRCLPAWLGVKAGQITPTFCPSALQAVARLCCPHLDADVPIEQFPVRSLLAAAPNAAVFERMGVRTWGQLRELPRYGLARRFGQGLMDALDMAFGEQTESYPWLQAPEAFDESAELNHWVTQADALLWEARRLLQRLLAWLKARRSSCVQCSSMAMAPNRRVDGQDIPPTAHVTVATAQATQDMQHLERLLHEQLQRTPLLSPVNHIRLTCPRAAAHEPQVLALLPEDRIHGMRWHELVERLSARLGEQHVRPQLHADHRPAHMQTWVPALRNAAPAGATVTSTPSDELWPNWWLREPLPLKVVQGLPQYLGPLELLSREQRIEAGWWASKQGSAAQPTLMDCFVAHSAKAGLLWIGRERSAHHGAQHSLPNEARWLLLGWYA
jgi:protein ImuB